MGRGKSVTDFWKGALCCGRVELVDSCIGVEWMEGGLGMLPCLDLRGNANASGSGSVDCGYGGNMLTPASRVRKGGRIEERRLVYELELFVWAWLLSESGHRVMTLGILE